MIFIQYIVNAITVSTRNDDSFIIFKQLLNKTSYLAYYQLLVGFI